MKPNYTHPQRILSPGWPGEPKYSLLLHLYALTGRRKPEFQSGVKAPVGLDSRWSYGNWLLKLPNLINWLRVWFPNQFHEDVCRSKCSQQLWMRQLLTNKLTQHCDARSCFLNSGQDDTFLGGGGDTFPLTSSNDLAIPMVFLPRMFQTDLQSALFLPCVFGGKKVNWGHHTVLETFQRTPPHFLPWSCHRKVSELCL